MMTTILTGLLLFLSIYYGVVVATVPHFVSECPNTIPLELLVTAQAPQSTNTPSAAFSPNVVKYKAVLLRPALW